MTIKLELNYLTQVVVWLDRPIWNTYTIICENKSTGIQYTTILDNISPIINQYTLFNIIAIDNETIPISNNVIYLPKKGEYTCSFYRGIDIQDKTTLAGTGLVVIKYDDVAEITFESETNNKLIYEG